MRKTVITVMDTGAICTNVTQAQTYAQGSTSLSTTIYAIVVDNQI